MAESQLETYEMELVPCTLCGGESFTDCITGAKDLYNHLDGEFNVMRCDNCDFVLTNPRPTRETIGYFYPDSTGYYQPETITPKTTMKERIFQSLLANSHGYPLPRLPKIVDALVGWYWRSKIRLNHFPDFWRPEARLMDIGCAWGRYLKIMQGYGWDVHGLEFNQQAVDYARNELGLTNVRQGMLEDHAYDDGFFDVVHMSMVLEHLHEPQDALAKIARMIKPDGQVILSVPNFASYEREKFDRYWYALQVPVHLNHFTPVTLRQVLDDVGLRATRIIHHKTDRDFINSARNAGNERLASILKCSPIRNILLRAFVSMLARRGRSGRMTVYACKK